MLHPTLYPFEERFMEKLDAGGMLPDVTLNIGESGKINLPADISTDYAIVLFYRGHW